MVPRTESPGREVAERDLHQVQITLRMLVLYVALTFAISWAFLIPALSTVSEDYRKLLFIPAAFGPFFSAVITIRLTAGWIGVRQWLRKLFTLRIPVSLYFAGAFLLPIGIGVLHYGLYRVLGGVPDFSTARQWYLYLPYLVPTALLTGGNEEPGWRGFALPALLAKFHPMLASTILGVVHSAWHLPLMSHYGTTFGLYLVNVIPLTFMLNWLYLKSRKCVIPVMLLHAGTNVIGGFFPTPMDVLGGLGTYMFLRSLVYWGIAIVLIIVTKGRLGYGATDTNIVE